MEKINYLYIYIHIYIYFAICTQSFSLNGRVDFARCELRQKFFYYFPHRPIRISCYSALRHTSQPFSFVSVILKKKNKQVQMNSSVTFSQHPQRH